jgi:hypothetical protein
MSCAVPGCIVVLKFRFAKLGPETGEHPIGSQTNCGSFKGRIGSGTRKIPYFSVICRYRSANRSV